MELLHIEQQRQALELSLQQLRQSLKHWQTLETEYEGLKEEVQQLEPASLDSSSLSVLAHEYGSSNDLVNEKEVRDIAGLDKDPNSPRLAAQIVGVIERRQEYVQKNIETIQRRFFEAEAKLEEFHFASRHDSEDGRLPLTEIHEELDDEDNVIASHLSQPESQQSRLVDSLRRAGLTDEDLEDDGKEQPALKPAITNASPPVASTPNVRPKSSSDLPTGNADGADHYHSPERPPIRKKSVSFTADTKAAREIVRIDSEDGKKSVSFAEKVAVAPAAPLPDPRSVSFSPNVEEIPAQPLGPPSPHVAPTQVVDEEKQKELRASFKPGDKVKEINDDDEVVAEHIVIPENESEEDAQTRREMLDYHLNEVGHVVAQMDLDEGVVDDEYDDDDASSHFTGSTYVEDEDTPYTSGMSDDDEDDEDEFGRSKRGVISEQYRQEMLETERRLIGNLGPAPKDIDIQDADLNLDARDAKRLAIRDKRSSTSSMSSDSSEKKAGNSKKRVSFAEEVDVAEPGSPPLKAQKHQEGQNVAPVTDVIAERTTAASHSLPAAPSVAKVSKFKKARAVPFNNDDTTAGSAPDSMDGASEPPNGTADKILADTLVERPTSSSTSTNPPSADDADTLAERRQLAAEYYRRRNDLIKQQGGFGKGESQNEEEELGELMEERADGRVKKVSRFMAGRVKPSSGG